jgi:hypothetical protein
MKMVKKRSQIAEANILLSQYGKMTIRQIYYKLVVKGIIKNSRSSYNSYNKNMVDARRNGNIDPRQILDSTRYIANKTHTSSKPQDFLNVVKIWLSNISDEYHSDLWKNQTRYLAIFVEKDALARIFEEVAKPYQVPVIVARGNGSDSQILDFIDYIKPKCQTAKKDVLIQVYSDLDPEGDVIAGDIISKKETEPQLDRRLHAYGFYNFSTSREAIKIPQIKAYNLQKNIPDMAKMARDTNSKAFNKLHGNYDCYELDAFDTDDLKNLIDVNILKHTDPLIWKRDSNLEDKSRKKIDKMLKKVNIP